MVIQNRSIQYKITFGLAVKYKMTIKDMNEYYSSIDINKN